MVPLPRVAGEDAPGSLAPSKSAKLRAARRPSISASKLEAGRATRRRPSCQVEKILQHQPAAAFFRADVACGQQAAEPAVGGAVLGVGEEVGRAVGEDEAGADEHAQAARGLLVVAQEEVRAHDAGERVAVGDADAVEPQRDRLRDKLFGVRGATQEREVRGDAEFGEPVGVDEADHD